MKSFLNIAIPASLATFPGWFGFILVVLAACDPFSVSDTNETAFAALGEIREDRKERVLSLLDHLMEKARKAPTDEALVNAFLRIKERTNRGEVQKNIQEPLFMDLDVLYVTEYGGFFDILFISPDGRIFHSIKWESDLGANIFGPRFSDTKLSRALRERTAPMFVDYDFYAPSNEPAAFFVAGLEERGTPLGWIAFQAASNSMNAILKDREGLGATGEVYIINERRLMLSDSRFVDGSTILNMEVDTEPTRAALYQDEGNLLARDYRGVRVFSSFEKFTVFGNNWIILSEMDENEVVTRWYEGNKDYFLPRIIGMLDEGADTRPPPLNHGGQTIRIDINEYAKGKPGELLVTHGISTCTGVVIYLPGRFAYLGHIYPVDKTYYSGVMGYFVGNTIDLVSGDYIGGLSDLLGEMIHEIKNYNIFPYELMDLRVLLVAVHTESVEGIVDTLLDAGFFLSQIEMLYGGEKRFANLTVEVGEREIGAWVEWVDEAGRGGQWNGVEGVADLGSLVGEIARRGSE